MEHYDLTFKLRCYVTLSARFPDFEMEFEDAIIIYHNVPLVISKTQELNSSQEI